MPPMTVSRSLSCSAGRLSRTHSWTTDAPFVADWSSFQMLTETRLFLAPSTEKNDSKPSCFSYRGAKPSFTLLTTASYDPLRSYRATRALDIAVAPILDALVRPSESMPWWAMRKRLRRASARWTRSPLEDPLGGGQRPARLPPKVGLNQPPSTSDRTPYGSSVQFAGSLASRATTGSEEKRACAATT